jgi:hypothetical protein
MPFDGISGDLYDFVALELIRWGGDRGHDKGHDDPRVLGDTD